MDTPISLSLNFDSLNEAYGFPPNYRDPSFFEAYDRLATLAAEFNFPLSIYIIGKDLENPENAARVREWAQHGHEIGNHSWSHHFNLASLPPNEIRDEIVRAHDLISEVAGKEPKGFIAPAWATSRVMLSTLVSNKYSYDTSTFPSMLLYPMTAKIALNHMGVWRKGVRMLKRQDWHFPLTAPTRPYLVGRDGRQTCGASDADSLLILPLPTLGRTRPCIWHTVGFMLGWPLLHRNLLALLAKHPSFYYLIHPGDYLGPDDLDPRFTQFLARMDQPLAEKMTLLREVFQVMSDSNRKVVTMKELAQFHRDLLSIDSK